MGPKKNLSRQEEEEEYHEDDEDKKQPKAHRAEKDDAAKENVNDDSLKPKSQNDLRPATKLRSTCSSFGTRMFIDVHAYVYSFLDANDHAVCRLVCWKFNIAFDHAFQRDYVACAIHGEYVEDVKTFYADGDPLHVAPVDQKKLFAPEDHDWCSYTMQRSKKDKNSTLIVNVAKMLGKGGTKLQDYFLKGAQFKAVHLIGTESLEEIGECFLHLAQKLVCFTMSSPCPKLRSVGNHWLRMCSALAKFDISGCTALESVGCTWLYGCWSIEGADFSALVSLKRVGSDWLCRCSSLKLANFAGCSALEQVGEFWMCNCRSLEELRLDACVSLKRVRDCWLYDCSSLRRVDFRGCSALEQVEDFWMWNCRSLEEIDLGACVSLKCIEEPWPHFCPSLRRVVLPSDTKLPDDFVERLERYLREKKAVVTRAEKDDQPASKKKRR